MSVKLSAFNSFYSLLSLDEVSVQLLADCFSIHTDYTRMAGLLLHDCILIRSWCKLEVKQQREEAITLKGRCADAD